MEKLPKINRKKANLEEIRRISEDDMIDNIDETIKDKNFYNLPIKVILKIIKESDITDEKLLNTVAKKMNSYKNEEAILLLNVIDPVQLDLKGCINIISNFKKCPICKKLGFLHEEENNLTEKDYEDEVKKLKSIIKTLEKSPNKDAADPVIAKSNDLENDLFKAAQEGKLDTVKHLAKQRDVNINAKTKYGWTPINIAALNGRLDVVKYLYEKYHADVEIKDNGGCTPLNNAARNGKLDVVKYLIENCNAYVETKDKLCGYTPIYNASNNGFLDVVKYLYESCHAKLTNSIILVASDKEIRNYLFPKIKF